MYQYIIYDDEGNIYDYSYLYSNETACRQDAKEQCEELARKYNVVNFRYRLIEQRLVE